MKRFVFVRAVFSFAKSEFDGGFYCCIDNVTAFRMTEYNDKPAVMFTIRGSSARYVTHDLAPFTEMIENNG